MAALATIQFPAEPTAFDIDAHPDTYTSDGNDDTARLVSGLGLWVKNTTAGAIDVTLLAQNPCDHDETHPSLVTVPVGFEGFIATRLQASRFGDHSLDVTIQYSAPGLRIAAVKTTTD